MTHWLTDCPDSTKCFLPDNAEWEKHLGRGDEETIAPVAETFARSKPVWHVEMPSSATSFPDRCFVLIDKADASQFDTALDSLRTQNSLPDGLVCLALTGSGFRGQRKRSWSAIRGNLHLTAHYALSVAARENQAALTMLPAVAAAEAISELLAIDTYPKIKWVNDVLIDEKKVSGVLTATTISGDTVERVVFGIGVNVKSAPVIEPTPFVPQAGCLAEIDQTLRDALPQLFKGIVAKLDELVICLRENRQEEVFRRYSSMAGFVGRNVRIWPEGTEDWRLTEPLACGRVDVLNNDLSLDVDGVSEKIRSGRLAFEENC